MYLFFWAYIGPNAILCYHSAMYYLFIIIIRLPPEFLPASGPTERWCASTLGAALLISSRVGSDFGACIQNGFEGMSYLLDMCWSRQYSFNLVRHLEKTCLEKKHASTEIWIRWGQRGLVVSISAFHQCCPRVKGSNPGLSLSFSKPLSSLESLSCLFRCTMHYAREGKEEEEPVGVSGTVYGTRERMEIYLGLTWREH